MLRRSFVWACLSAAAAISWTVPGMGVGVARAEDGKAYIVTRYSGAQQAATVARVTPNRHDQIVISPDRQTVEYRIAGMHPVVIDPYADYQHQGVYSTDSGTNLAKAQQLARNLMTGASYIVTRGYRPVRQTVSPDMEQMILFRPDLLDRPRRENEMQAPTPKTGPGPIRVTPPEGIVAQSN